MLRTWVRLAGRGLRQLSIDFGRRSRRRELGRAALSVLDSLESRTLLSGMANDDTLVVQRKDVTLAIDVLANDVPTSGTLAIADFTQGANGAIALIPAGDGHPDRLSYTPSTGFVGTDTFTYTVQDSADNQDAATVTIDIAPADPSAAAAPPAPLEAPTYTLSNGFGVGPYATCTPVASGNYSFTDTTSLTSTETWTPTDGPAHTVSKTGTKSLTVTVAALADGSWAYSESFTNGLTTITAPVSGTAGLTETSTNSSGYSFVASGSATGSTYTFTSGDGASGSGLLQSVWDDSAAGGSVGTMTQPVGESGGDSALITNVSDLSAGTSTGTSSLSGSWSYSIGGSGPYSYSAGGETGGGTATASQSSSGSYLYSATGGTYSESGSTQSSYSGGGAYSYTMDDGSVSGTTTRSAGQSDVYSVTIVFNV